MSTKFQLRKTVGNISVVISEVGGRILLKLMLKKWSVRI